MARKETVIQLGKGEFLGGFVDYSLQKMQDKGLFDGFVVIVQPIEKGMYSVLEQQGCEYSLFLKGIDNGQVVDEHTYIDIIPRYVNPHDNFKAYMKLAENPDPRFVMSNTTEAGIEYVDSNQFADAPVRPFFDKLTQLLYKRYRLGFKGFTILSCELADHNDEKLEKCCLRYAKQWELGEESEIWLVWESDFCSTLVDRIVTGFPRDEHEELCRRIDEQDNTMDTAEILHLWVIQESHEDEPPLQKASFHMVWTDSVDPYKKRKVYILNGAHTPMVLGAHSYGLKTVGECLKDEKVSALSRKCIFRGTIPVISDTEDNRKFGEAMLERFSNSFIRHMFPSIALNSVSKFRARVLPTILEYRDTFGSCPQGPTFSLATLMASCHTNDADDSQEIMDFMKTAPVEDILRRGDYWGQDLGPLLADVERWYELIETEGMDKAYNAVLSESEQMPVRHK